MLLRRALFCCFLVLALASSLRGWEQAHAIPPSNLLEVVYHSRERNYSCDPGTLQTAIAHVSGDVISQHSVAADMKTGTVKGIRYNFDRRVLEVPAAHTPVYMIVADVAVPHSVLVGRSFIVTVTVEWSGLQELRCRYGPPYSVRVEVCEGSSSDYAMCRGLGYGPSKSGDIVEPSGSKTYSIEITPPGQVGVWHLAAFFTILNRVKNSWGFPTHVDGASREFDVNVTDRVALIVQTEPAKLDVTVSVDGRAAYTDAAGRVQFYVSIICPHTIEVPSEVLTGTRTKVVFVKWSDGETSSSRATMLTEDTTLTAKYKTQYLLTVNSPMGNPQGSGWYDERSTATFSVTSPLTAEGLIGILGGKLVLDHWCGDSTATAATGSVVMDGPKTVCAEWRTDNAMPYIITGVIITVVIVIVALLLLVRRRKAVAPAQAYQPAPASKPSPAALVAVPSRTKYCIHCGTKIPEEAELCPNCSGKQP